MFKKAFLFFLIAVVVLGLKRHNLQTQSQKYHKLVLNQAYHLKNVFGHLGSLSLTPKHHSKTNLHRQKYIQHRQYDSLTNFIMNDEELFSAAINGQDLNPSQMKKIMNFMINDPQYSQQLIEKFSEGMPWVSKLSDQGKKTFLNISMQTMMNQQDFDPMDQSQPTPETISSMLDQLLQDQEIGDAMLSGIDWSQLPQDKKASQWAQSILGEDADLTNLTRDEKIQLFMAINEAESQEQSQGQEESRKH